MITDNVVRTLLYYLHVQYKNLSNIFVAKKKLGCYHLGKIKSSTII